MKGLVVYYSAKGSNRYLALRIAEKSGFDMEEIHPRINAQFPLIFSSLTNLGGKIRKIRSSIASYDTIILCGPIWMGQVISPLRSFISKYKSQISQLYFVTCCGGGDEQKDDPFGYESVFAKVSDLLGSRFIRGFAVPIPLLIKPGLPNDAVMKTRLSPENFPLVEKRFSDVLEGILKESPQPRE